MGKIRQVHKLQILCKPLGKGYFCSKEVPIIPETFILHVKSKTSGGGIDPQKCPYVQ